VCECPSLSVLFYINWNRKSPPPPLHPTIPILIAYVYSSVSDFPSAR
jgi:hypothetical protein